MPIRHEITHCANYTRKHGGLDICWFYLLHPDLKGLPALPYKCPRIFKIEEVPSILRKL